MLFLKSKGVKISILTTLIASSFFRLDEVAAQESKNLDTNTEETTIELEGNFKNQLIDFITNNPKSVELEKNLKLAIEDHILGNFEEADDIYEEILNNLDIDDDLFKLISVFADLSNAESELNEDNLEKLLDKNNILIETDKYNNKFNTEKNTDLESLNNSHTNNLISNKETTSDEDDEKQDNTLSDANSAQKELADATGKYEEVLNASNASTAWKLAQEFKIEYATDSRVEKAINDAARRILVMGQSNHKKMNFQGAVHYYKYLLAEPLVSTNIRENVEIHYLQASNSLSMQTEDEMLEAVLKASTASEAWKLANNFKKCYSESNLLSQAFASAGRRIYNMGVSHHKTKDFNNAIYYYNLLLNEPNLTSEDIIREAQFLKEQAENQSITITEDDLLQATIKAINATSAWSNAQKLKTIYPKSKKLTEAFGSASQRIYNMGINSHKSKQYNLAMTYYDLLINEPLISKSLRTEATVYYTQASKGEKIQSSVDIYNSVIKAPTASTAWNKAQQMKELFPYASELNSAFLSAGQRIYSMGISSHKSKEYNLAMTYYNMLINEPLISDSLQAEVTVYYRQASDKKVLKTAENLLSEVKNAPTASAAWDRALNFKKEFPESDKVSLAFISAGKRIYNMGVSNHRSTKFDSAIIYYNLLLEESLISESMKEDVKFLKKQALKKSTIIDADKTLKESLNASTASKAWYIAHEGLEVFPNDTRFIDAIRKAADRLYSMGVSNHKNGKFSIANTYYGMLMNSDHIKTNMKEKVKYYSRLANNNLYLTNIVIKNTEYNYSLNNAIALQLSIKGAKPQMSYNGGWRNATKSEVSQYINPDNQLPKNTDIEDALSEVEIIANTLNVRSGPGTNYSLINTVSRGEVYTITDERNGWYEIVVKGSKGWVSGSTNYVSRNNSVLQFLILSGSSGISISDLNSELNSAGILKGYGSAFHEASKKANINELYLISHALLETGNGTSQLSTGILVEEINGKPVKPRIVYNMFGIGAVDSNPEKLGAEKAYKEGWFSPREAIIGGAQWISSSYINNPTYKQDTLYKMRWNPERPGLHQYATDVAWASKQTNTLNQIVYLSRKYDLLLTFDIPLYD